MADFDMGNLSPGEIYKLLIGCVVPRPIAWVSSMSSAGVPNIAPFSYFNAVSSLPPMLGFSVAEPKVPEKRCKDTLACIRETNEFVVNLATVELLDRLVVTSVEFMSEVDEFEVAGLSKGASRTVAVPRIAEAPVSFECRLHTTLELGTSVWVIGEVLLVHVKDGLLDDQLNMDVASLRPLGRLAGPTFCTELNVVTRAVRLSRPEAGAASELEWLGTGH